MVNVLLFLMFSHFIEEQKGYKICSLLLIQCDFNPYPANMKNMVS